MSEAELKAGMDRYIGEARGMKPFPGMDRAELAGGLEWQWTKDNKRNGIPVSPEHREALETVAAELRVDVPFARYENTRF